MSKKLQDKHNVIRALQEASLNVFDLKIPLICIVRSNKYFLS